jgi:hypothetical protein
VRLCFAPRNRSKQADMTTQTDLSRSAALYERC